MSTNILGIFCISVIIYDVLQNNWEDLPYHSIVSIVFLSFFHLACLLLGDTISLAILLIPAVVILVSLVTVWFTSKSLNAQGCCMTCKPKPVCTDNRLKATPLPISIKNTCPTDTCKTITCPTATSN